MIKIKSKKDVLLIINYALFAILFTNLIITYWVADLYKDRFIKIETSFWSVHFLYFYTTYPHQLF